MDAEACPVTLVASRNGQNQQERARMSRPPFGPRTGARILPRTLAARESEWDLSSVASEAGRGALQ